VSADRYAVLVVLEGRVLTLDQVASDAQLTEDAAGRLLEALIRDSLVSSVRWLSGGSQYELTRTGRGVAGALIKAANYSGSNVHERVMQVRRISPPGPPPRMRRSPGARRGVRQPAGKLSRVRRPAVPPTPGTPESSRPGRGSLALGLVGSTLFFLTGLSFFRGPFEVADTVFGLIFTISPLLWTYLAWSRFRRG
jgi:hypothetical protein